MKLTHLDLPRGINRVWIRRPGRQPYEVFQVNGSPNGIKKCWRVCIAPRGERQALKLAIQKRAEWEKTTAPWGGNRNARIRVDASSVPDSLKFPGLHICSHRALVMATRRFRSTSGDTRTIYLCYPYSIEGGTLPTFVEALEQCRRGQGVLNALPTLQLESIWKRHKKANRIRKRGENMSNALLSFDAFVDGPGSKQEMARLSHAYERRAS